MCSCKTNKISGMKNMGGFKTETLLYVGAGAIASKAITNPLLKALKLEADPTETGIKKYAPIGVKLALGYFGLQQKNPMIRQMALGAIAAGLLEGAEVFAPSVFAPKLAAGIVPMRVNGINAPVQVLNLDATTERVAGYEEDARVAGLASYM